MSQAQVLSIVRNALYMVILLSAPMAIFGLVVGIIVSIFQAVTQINEQTLVFIPKIIAIIVALILFGPWMLNTMVDFTNDIFHSILSFIQ
ncbi:MAG: flagellar biosynthesis protein FliQ [Clostridiales bacterium]|jgi:flagellar biosynthetic protein FliQ|nr:flagellar biosynthesis protein FliQ [Clostridiales bacterium]MDK2991627.1 flagellar biosynthesis protein FliQ [Clostridiales bacterium]